MCSEILRKARALLRPCHGGDIDLLRLLRAVRFASYPTAQLFGGKSRMRWVRHASITFVVLVLLTGAGLFIYKRLQSPASSAQRALTRLTFDDGLQVGSTWSPDSRFIAYSSNRGGKFDIWVQQVSGGDPVQVTKGRAYNWQPAWSPDGKYILSPAGYGDDSAKSP
jgi:hypothetical protein